jgi:hypothetical protein
MNKGNQTCLEIIIIKNKNKKKLNQDRINLINYNKYHLNILTIYIFFLLNLFRNVERTDGSFTID